MTDVRKFVTVSSVAAACGTNVTALVNRNSTVVTVLRRTSKIPTVVSFVVTELFATRATPGDRSSATQPPMRIYGRHKVRISAWIMHDWNLTWCEGTYTAVAAYSVTANPFQPVTRPLPVTWGRSPHSSLSVSSLSS